MKTCLVTVSVVVGLMVQSFACDSGWQYIGHPEWEIICAVPNPAVNSGVLAGTASPWYIPESGGVWAQDGADTTWQYSGLVGRTVYKLTRFPYCRPNVFASTSLGLYMQIEDTTWTRITGAGTPQGQHWDFAVSPFDTSLWVVVRNDLGSGQLIVSRSSGESWYYYYFGTVSGDLLFSRQYTNKLYFVQSSLHLCRTDFADSTIEVLMGFNDDAIMGLTYHPTEPWVYVAGLYSMGRYDEATGDTLHVPLPPEVEYTTTLAYDSEGLLVSAPAGFYRVSDDLASWEQVQDTVSSAGWGFFYSSPSVCITGRWDQLYVSEISQAVRERNTSPARDQIAVFPNPTNGDFTLSLPDAARLDMFDILGRKVFGLRFALPGTRQISMSELPSGTYFLQVTPVQDVGRSSNYIRLQVTK